MRVTREMEMKPERRWSVKPIIGRGKPNELGHRALWIRLPFGRWVRKITRDRQCPYRAVMDGGSYTATDYCLRLKGHDGDHRSLSYEWSSKDDSPIRRLDSGRCPTCGDTGPDPVDTSDEGQPEAACGDEWHDPVGEHSGRDKPC